LHRGAARHDRGDWFRGIEPGRDHGDRLAAERVLDHQRPDRAGAHEHAEPTRDDVRDADWQRETPPLLFCVLAERGAQFIIGHSRMSSRIMRARVEARSLTLRLP
jgi:hypothetical protein